MLTPELPPDGDLAVTVEVANVGSRPGVESVQLYVSFEGSMVDRPVKLLRASRLIRPVERGSLKRCRSAWRPAGTRPKS